MSEHIMNPVRITVPEVHLKRRGQKAYMYVDLATNTPLPLVNFEDEPLGGLAIDMSVEEAIERFGNKIVWHAEPIREEKLAQIPLTPQQLEREIASVVKGQQPEVAITTPVVSAASPSMTNIEEKVLTEFKLLMVRYDSLEGKKKAQFGVQVTAVASFILSIAPHLSPALNQIKEEVSKPKFTL